MYDFGQFESKRVTSAPPFMWQIELTNIKDVENVYSNCHLTSLNIP